MERLIVNEGQGPRSFDLVVGRMVVGSTPDCDVRLRHAAAAGSQFVVERTLRGHRAVRLTGELLVNEQPCEVADLSHNDTLRVGESLILYKNPDAVAPRRAAPPPLVDATRAGAAPAAELPDVEALGALEELEELETLDELEALEELEELEELEGPEALEELPAVASLEELPVFEEPAAIEAPPAPKQHEDPVALDELEDLDELDALDDLEALPAPQLAPVSREPVRVLRPAESGAGLASRFRRPLPPGHAAPTSPPPADPGPPPVRPGAS